MGLTFATLLAALALVLVPQPSAALLIGSSTGRAAAQPMLTPAGGTFTSNQLVQISDATTGASIHYTTDGTMPNASSPVYVGAIPVSGSETVKAIAICTGYLQSAAVTAAYTILPPAPAPELSLAGGTYLSAQPVTLTDSLPGATIFYTLDGTTPAMNTPKSTYTAPIEIRVTRTLEAIAVAPGYSPSPVTKATYTITPPAAMPMFSLPPGAYGTAQTVELTAATPGAAIYYTADGAAPTTASVLYAGPISLMSNETIRAMAIAPGYSRSAIAAAAYSIASPAPVFSLSAGTYTSIQELTISDSAPGATIYYTVNGTVPTLTTPKYTYSAPISIRATETIQAIAVVSGNAPSPVTSVGYVVTPPAAVPRIFPAPGTYTSAQTLQLIAATPGATIYYTTDGSIPTTASNLYTGPISVSSTETINAMEVAPSYSPSSIAAAAYTIMPPTPAPVFSTAPGTYTSSQMVAISDSAQGATIYYTLNGTTPTLTTSKYTYTGPIAVNATETIEAIAVASGNSPSAAASATYTITPPANAPQISPAPGAYNSAQTVQLTAGTPGAMIYYTIDGSLPTTASTPYAGAIAVSSTETVNAAAIAPGFSLSAVASAAYTINPPAPAPVFSAGGGTYISAQTITMSDEAPGATIYYTLNGTAPTLTSSKYTYTAPITVRTSVTIEAIAVAANNAPSAATSATYVITPPAAAPQISPAQGTYNSPQTVQLSAATPGAAIYYTTDGSAPTLSSIPYTGPITVSSTETINAIAAAQGYSPSPAATAVFTINQPAPPPVFSVAGGTYSSVLTLTISDAAPGATIYYTLNGTVPAMTTPKYTYTGPITVRAAETIESRATAPGYAPSTVTAATYAFNPPAAAPQISPSAGTYSSTQSVQLLASTPGATIYYTTDGTTPTPSSLVYAGPLTVASSETISAIAAAPGFSQSPEAIAVFTINPAAPAPVFSVAAGTYTTPQPVAISDAVAGAIIYYTLNGTAPTLASSKLTYNGPVSISSNSTIEAIAVAPGYSVSTVTNATYTITPPAATPRFSPAAGTYITAQSVAITCGNAGAAIYYTTDGTVPTTGSALYTGEVVVTATETLNAVAIAPGYSQSAAGTAAYVITPPAPAPGFSLPGGTYTTAQTISLISNISGASIYYTTDGTAPTISSSVFGGAMPVTSTETIHAIALAPGYSQSAVAAATYTIEPPAPAPTFSVTAGTYASAQTVTIADAAPGATIYYTLNGTTPTITSTLYTGPIQIAAIETVNASAIAPGYSLSAPASASYFILPTLIIATPAALPAANAGAFYAANIVVSGGGPWYTWTVNGATVAANGAGVALTDGVSVSTSGGSTLTVGGIPAAAGSVLFSVSAQDNFTGVQSGTVAFSVAVNTPAPMSLPAPTPSTMGPATAQGSYAGYIGVSGGAPGYAWTVTGLSDNLNWTTGTLISTVAGNGSAGWSGDGGPATSAQIGNFGGVAVDLAGNIYFADSVSSVVRVVNAAGIVSTAAGTGTPGYNGDNIAAGTAQLTAPVGVAVDLDGDLYIADAGNNRIRMMSATTGMISTVAGTGVSGYNGDNLPATSAELNGPTGVAVDGAGNLYIADAGNARVRMVSAITGMISTVAGNGSKGFSGDGGLATLAQFRNPFALAADSLGNLYISDLSGTSGSSTTAGRIRKVTAATGLIATVAGSGGTTYNGDGIAAPIAELGDPVSVAVDGNGNLYIADAGNNRIRLVTPATDVISTVAGTGAFGYNGDGIPSALALVANPQGVAVDSAGNVYIADGSNRIRMVQNPAVASQLIVEGTPPSTGTVTFQVSVQDATGTTAGPVTYSVNATAALPLALPLPNPGSLGSAVVGQSYSGAIVATGGVPNYAWAVNGVSLAANGLPVKLADGLSVSNNGGNTLTIGGTPAAAGTVTFRASVKGRTNPSAITLTYSISVMATAGYPVIGQVSLSNCGAPAQGVTVTINTAPAQVASTDGNGQFSFQNIPAGSYTVTPSIVAETSAFYPASQPVVINGSGATGVNFAAAIGYEVSGAVSYGGTKTGWVYLELTDSTCSGSPLGVGLRSARAFTIHGVPPGAYTLQGWMDNQGYGAENASNPTGITPGIVVTNANLSAVSLTLADPAPVVTPAPPTIQWSGAFNRGILIGYAAAESGNGVEQATSYTLQWSTRQDFSSLSGSHNFAATGENGGSVWILTGLSNSFTYYFRAQSVASGTAGNWSATYGPVTIGASTGANTVSGTISFSTPSNHPLYAGFYDPIAQKAYVTLIAPAVSPQNYSIQAPTGTGYQPFAFIDQNNDGMADPGDINGMSGNGTIAVTGNTNYNMVLPGGSTALVETEHLRQITSAGYTDSYDLSFSLNSPISLPVTATLVSGPNVMAPMDMGKCGVCGSNQFDFWVGIDSALPNVGDAYGVNVVYAAVNSVTETLTAAVTGVVNTFSTGLSPMAGPGAGVTPTFSWTPPAGAGSYTFSFTLMDGSGNTIWEIPGSSSPGAGFSSSVTSIAWGADPTGAANPPSVASLTPGMNYTWAITARDVNGNTGQELVSFQP